MAMYGRMFPAGRNEDYDRGLRLFDQGLYEAAIPELEKVAGLVDQENTILVKLASFYLAECWSYLGSYAIGQRLFDRAASCLLHALERNPGYADLHSKLAAVFYLQDKIEEAIKELEVSLKINPQYAQALIQFGICQYRLGQSGLASVNKAIEYNPKLKAHEYDLGVLAHADGDFNAALNHFSLLINSDADEVAYHARLGSDFYRRGMLDEASKEFELALTVNPDYADLHNSLGMIYHLSGKHEDAIAQFKKALNINPDYVEAKYNLTISSQSFNRSTQAVKLRLIDDDSEDRSNNAS
jgi:tetratricopeptide (TPR) repeat protein